MPCRCCIVGFMLTSLAFTCLAVSGDQNPDLKVANHAASIVGVRPISCAPKLIKKFAWRIEKALLKCVSWFHIPDSKLSLRVLWWKAIFGNNSKSPVFDNGLAYDMLPGFVRLLVSRPFSPLYPRWTHVVIEIRTAYLDSAVRNLVNSAKSNDRTTKIRLITMGGGYDIRSIKLQDIVDEAIELDLPDVVGAKRSILQRLQKRRPECRLPTLYAVDLLRLDNVSSLLQTILGGDGDDESWHTIFLFEGVLMYLDENAPMELIRVCRRAVDGHSASLCFADAILKDSDDREIAELELSKAGWRIVDWLVKGGRTRHMGIAEKLS